MRGGFATHDFLAIQMNSDFAWNIMTGFWNTVADMSPYLLFGFFVAGLLSVLVSGQLVETHLGGRGFRPLFKSSVFGVPLPLCSCGVIPVSMSLHRHGASKGSTIAFLLSTPQTGVDSIVVTYSLLGPVFAVFRPLAALATGLIGGMAVDVFDHDKETLKKASKKCSDDCCGNPQETGKIRKGFEYGFITLPRDIGRAMLIGILIAALISAVVPDDFFAAKLGTGIFAMLIMMILGIPVYVCATASIPVAAALMMKGLTPGAAIVFLMTGPATNAASFATLWKTLGGKTAVIYLVSVAGCALASGLLLDYFYFTPGMTNVVHRGWMLPDAARHISAVVLLAIVGYALLAGKKHAEKD